MASPKLATFFVLHGTTNLPATGLSPTFSSYKNDQGTNVTQPTISEIGGGWYKFTPVFADPARGISFVISTGHNPLYVVGYVRPEDWNADNADVASSTLATSTDMASALSNIASVNSNVSTVITDLAATQEFLEADEIVHTTGADANRAVRQKGDGTVLKKWDLFGEDHVTPDPENPFYRKGV